MNNKGVHMVIEKALALKPKMLVRTDDGKSGHVVIGGTNIEKNMNDVPYVWITVSFNGFKSNWPSNRLM
jgi:hypothetical protein